jgi:hypothetical protein
MSADQLAAHHFLSELRTRISTQPLPYQHGVESAALESLRKIFDYAREAMEKYPDCQAFADETTDMLNTDLRPFTAKWHKALVEGRLNSKDGADEFRGELAVLQGLLLTFTEKLYAMAYKTQGYHDKPTPPVMDTADISACLKPLPFGIPSKPIPADVDPSLQKRVADGNKSFAEINAEELADVLARRAKLETTQSKESNIDAVGLGLSGGGIRSASFSLGVVQVLADRELLKEVDYLSTVSGGGYTGSFLTRRLGGNPNDTTQQEGAEIEEVAGPHGPDPYAVRYLRLRAEFLSPANMKETWAMVTATYAGMLLNWTGPLFIIVAMALFAISINRFLTAAVWGGTIAVLVAMIIIALGLYCYSMRCSKWREKAGGFLAIMTAVLIMVCIGWVVQAGYVHFPKLLHGLWSAPGWLAAAVAVGPAIIRFVPVFKSPVMRKIVLRALLMMAGLILPLGALAIFYAFCHIGELRPLPQIELAAKKPEGRIFISYAREDMAAAKRFDASLESAGVKTWIDTNDLKPGAVWSTAIEDEINYEAPAFVSLISSNTEQTVDRWFIAERNLAALRARKFPNLEQFYFPVVIDPGLVPSAQGFQHEPSLVRGLQAAWCPEGIAPATFCQQLADLQKTRAARPQTIGHLKEVDGRLVLLLVAGLCGLVAFFPLNINWTSPHRLYRDRLARTFIQVSEAGLTTVPLEEINPCNRAPYHLINTTLNVPSSQDPTLHDRKCDFFVFTKHWSGSEVVGYRETGDWQANGGRLDLATVMAVSGAAASSYMGLGTEPTLTALLAFMNIRLGFWLKQPGRPGRETPGFSCLWNEMLGSGMSEKDAWLNLSDGGHIENMGVYELLLRRCKYIICVDGEADPLYTFEGLMTLVRHARIDFGIHIDAKLDQIRPDTKTGLSQTHAILCRVSYPPPPGQTKRPVGLLLYFKLSVTGNESELIKRYRINHPEFPHQTTLDQFFDQEQFEAYRELGVHVAEGMLSKTLLNNAGNPPSITKWFERLAGNLLEPVV